ncbi:ribosomal protein L7/L12 [Salininema proteolyticum]|uniref:Ribosomal protein L7/L12 n=1 Tax=Salininema proteolyticum TaxID=1607685 RepID=A0ABV8TWB7_9ACTN
MDYVLFGLAAVGLIALGVVLNPKRPDGDRSSRRLFDTPEPVGTGPYEVLLRDPGRKKIPVVKVLRRLTSVGLAEARAWTEDVPAAVMRTEAREEASRAVEALRGAGALAEFHHRPR